MVPTLRMMRMAAQPCNRPTTVQQTRELPPAGVQLPKAPQVSRSNLIGVWSQVPGCTLHSTNLAELCSITVLWFFPMRYQTQTLFQEQEGVTFRDKVRPDCMHYP